jgi:hypothetical protein
VTPSNSDEQRLVGGVLGRQSARLGNSKQTFAGAAFVATRDTHAAEHVQETRR